MCSHLRTEVIEYEEIVTTEDGPEYRIEAHTYCLDCGEEVEAPALEWLAVDPEPTVYEIELGLVIMEGA